MKIAVVTPGRAHLLDMAIQLLNNGHDVKLYTMVSKKRCESFGFPAERVISFFALCAPLMLIFRKVKLPGDYNRHLYYYIVRLVDKLSSIFLDKCDLLIGISGCAIISAKKAQDKYGAQFFCDRGCRHILSQDEILKAIPTAEQVYTKDIKNELEQYRIADKIILPSQHTQESFEEKGFVSDKLFVNPYGVNISMFRPTILSQDSFDIIFVGNWSYQKGVDILVEACRKGGFSLLHVGAIADCPFPANESSQFCHVEPVNQPELTKYYSKAKVLCLPSRQDGFGLVLFQAMACGLPLVYSHTTGGPDLKRLVNNSDYLFETPLETADSVRETLQKALQKARQQTVGKPRKYLPDESLANISWEAYGKRYNDFLQQQMSYK